MEDRNTRGVDFVVEKLMELINSSDVDELMKRKQIQWIYEEMQFLRKFVNDSDHTNAYDEAMKDALANIRDITCKVQYLLDLFHLVSHNTRNSEFNFTAHRSKTEESTSSPPAGFCFSLKLGNVIKNIYKSRMPKMKNGQAKHMFHLVSHNTRNSEFNFTAHRSKTEESTSSPPAGFCFSLKLGNVIKNIYKSRMPKMKNGQAKHMNIELSLDQHIKIKSVTENIVYLAKKIYHAFVPWVEVIYSIKSCKEEIIETLSYEIEEFPETCDYKVDKLFPSFIINEFCHLHSFSGKLSHVLMVGMSLTWPDFCQPGDYLLLSNMFKYMARLARRISLFRYFTFSREMRFFETNIMPHYSHKVGLFSFLECLSKKMANLVKNISYMHPLAVDDIRPMMTGIPMNFDEGGFDVSRLESLVIDNIRHGFGCVVEEIESVKTQVMEIYDKKTCDFGVPQIGNSSHGAAVRCSKPMVEEEIMVGFDDEKTTVIELLIGEHEKQLKLIAMVGMPGLGKTTLAGKIYNDPFIVDHFPTRAWTYVSQVYQKREMLLGILSSAFYSRDEISELSNEKLGEELYKRLKGKRYLIVMDDIWNIRAWDDFKIYFPDDNKGSRIMFTTRLLDVAMALHAVPHCLRFLNENESWNLLQQRVFQRETCPPELIKIGKQIAEKCQGLPLATVVIAGLLAKNVKTLEWWSHVARSVSSYIVSDPELYMDTLALSYNHLPLHLKSCFLYFSAFPEDKEIPVRKLVWLWVAEGFVHQTGGKSLEDVAEDYLMDLIDRSLVLIVRRRSTGGIKSCRVHDLLHDLCLRKAKEKDFLQQIDWYEAVSSSSCTTKKQLFSFIAEKQCRSLCIRSRNFHDISSELIAPHIHSFLYFGSERSAIPPKDMLFIVHSFKLLRVLDLSKVNVSTFSYLIIQLVFLRYLALGGNGLELPYNISKLQNLETLIVSKGGLTYLPTTIWNMINLRHLCIGGENCLGIVNEYKNSFVLNNLQTISQVCPSSECQKVLARTPNLQKLVFCGRFESLNCCFWFPDLDFLDHLKILKLFNLYIPDNHKYNLQGVKFPPNLKELTLSNTSLAWKEMSIIGSLPNLESLKLEFQACVGPQWETSDGGFCQLKFLRFYCMKIEKWNASNNHFPVLERLVLHRCQKLKEIPFEFGDIDTLQMIELSCCSDSAINSARQIQEEQQGIGNDFLKIRISNPRYWKSHYKL